MGKPTLNTVANQQEIMQNDLTYIRADLSEIKKALQENYVTKDQFIPVRRIAYGAVTFVSAVFVTAFGYIVSSGIKAAPK
jgi:hypothetical protein